MSADEEDDFMVEDELNFSDSDDDMNGSGGDDDGSSSSSDSDSDSDADKDKDEDAMDDDEEVTPESLKMRIEEVKQAIKDGRAQLNTFKQERKDAIDMLASLKKRQNDAQRRKNAFCSLKRSEVCYYRTTTLAYSLTLLLPVLERCPQGGFPHRSKRPRW